MVFVGCYYLIPFVNDLNLSIETFLEEKVVEFLSVSFGCDV